MYTQMSLGLFVFSLKTAPFDKLNRHTGFRWVQNNRSGTGAAAQYLGPGDDVITLKGQLAPEISGGEVNLDRLHDMAAIGKAWPLVTGRGKPLGYWYIEDISTDKSYFTDDGQARLIDFSLKLKKNFNSDLSQLGDLKISFDKQEAAQ